MMTAGRAASAPCRRNPGSAPGLPVGPDPTPGEADRSTPHACKRLVHKRMNAEVTRRRTMHTGVARARVRCEGRARALRSAIRAAVIGVHGRPRFAGFLLRGGDA